MAESWSQADITLVFTFPSLHLGVIQTVLLCNEWRRSCYVLPCPATRVSALLSLETYMVLE